MSQHNIVAISLCLLISPSYTADVMTNYAFQKHYRFLEQPDFICPFTENINEITELVPWMNLFSFLGYFATYTPPWLLKQVLPGSHGLLDFKSVCHWHLRYLQ